MRFLGWYTLVMMALGVLVQIAMIGKRREPLDGGSVAVATILNAPIIIYACINLF